MTRSPFSIIRTAFLASCVMAPALAHGSSFDWTALARVHARALAHYRSSPANERGPARDAACRMLQTAGADRAMSEPVAAISPTQAAAILNDFGFFATPDCVPWPMPELAIRRALALDPHRNVAHLNLGDVLRVRLQTVLDGTLDPEKQRADIRREYQAYLKGGGTRTLDMGHWADPPPLAAGTAGDVCSIVKAYLDAGRLMEISSAGAEHVPTVDGPNRVDIRYEGSGMAPSVVASNEADGMERVVETGGVRAEAAVLGIGNDVQVLILERGAESGTTVSLKGRGGCEISRDAREVVSGDSAEPAVCRSLLTSDNIRDIEFNQPPAISDDALAERWTGEYSGARAVGSALVDMANTGHAVRILLLETSMRQPDLCTVRLHDLLSSDGHRLADAAERAALDRLGIQADDPAQHDADCYGETHYLVQGQRTLVESLEHGQSDPNTPDQRRVSINERGQWRELCSTKAAVRWLVEPAKAGN